MAELISYACRKCSAGWWNTVMPPICPRCNGALVITDRAEAHELKR